MTAQPPDAAADGPPVAGRGRRLVWTVAALLVAALTAASLSVWNSHKAAAFETGTWYNIESRHSGLVLGIRAASLENGAELVQWDSNGSHDQQFRFLDSGDGYYRIQARHSGKVLDVYDWNAENGAQIVQYDDLGGTNQQWRIEEGDGYVSFINRFSGKALDVWEWSTERGARISQYDPTGGWNQQWRLIKADGDDGSGDLPEGVDALEGFAEGTTGGAGGETVTATNQAELEDYLSADEPYVIRVDRAITISPKGHEMDIASNKTVVGVGTSGEIVGGGFIIEGSSNIIIRNLTIRDTLMPEDDPGDDQFDYDAIQMDGASNIWIDHNHVTRMNDGLIDSREDTTNLTVSWNVIAEGDKAFGIGWTDNVTAEITIHHNWLRGNGSRNPSTDNVAHAHLYNNYLQDISGYGNYSRGYTKMVIENSYYENVTDPYYPDSTAELVQSGSICVDCSGRQETQGSAFDPGDFYDYTLHPAEDVPALLAEYAGPQDWIG